MSLSLVSVACIYYWSLKYHFSVGNPGRHELLEGEAMLMLSTSPVWLGLIGVSALGFRQLSIIKKLFGFLPIVLVALPLLIRVLLNAQ